MVPAVFTTMAIRVIYISSFNCNLFFYDFNIVSQNCFANSTPNSHILWKQTSSTDLENSKLVNNLVFVMFNCSK